MRDTFALAALIFFSCKLLFGLFSWFVSERKVAFKQQQIDRACWQLRQGSFQSFLSHLLARIVQRIRESFLSENCTLWPLLYFSLFYHLLSFFLALELLALVESIIFEVPYDAGDGLWQFVYLDPHDRLWPWWLYPFAAVCGVGFDVLSAIVTWTLLQRANRASTLLRMLGFLLLDGLLLLVILAGAVLFLVSIVSAILPRNIDYTDIILIVTQVISVTAPTLACGSIGFVMLSVRWMPTGLRHRLFALLSKFAPENGPVLSRMGTVFGAIIAIIVAAVKILL